MTPEQFKQHRDDLGLKEDELAKKLRLSINGKRWIRNIEKGEGKPSDMLLALYQYIIREHYQKKLLNQNKSIKHKTK